jgi:hypothetical protein
LLTPISRFLFWIDFTALISFCFGISLHNSPPRYSLSKLRW